MHMGYTLLPEESPEKLNDAFLSYSLITNSIEPTEKPSIASPMFLIDSSVVEILTGGVHIESALGCGMQEIASPSDLEREKNTDEVEYEVSIDFTALEREYEMIGVDKEHSEVSSIGHAGQYMYEITAGEEKYIAKCATVDENVYVVFSEEGQIYSIDKSCTVRKQSDRRLEE
ncbi:hypothetical protein NEMIN01_0145 [Nematocida minor]|uniref:uncharacterized protein n=1 Tax=Nematocida minor TaxID=1912983 RepID=UPI00221F7CCE|nr:uncharacterized protein NEMIN01_0041 [Nematocida minor]XP_051332047.1 uncharacterized protein NEMIN01_0145 [Nematocida minor]KAI5188777.1 hypothetical protein NEMIN01_0041 [Nematocida minor]KAI5188881.1 hypothetical protein NEMIN01_0145 [Nematocida minor]